MLLAPTLRFGIVAFTFWLALGTTSTASAAGPDFDREVLPILVGRCFDCHSGEDAKGSYDISRRTTANEAIVAGKPDASLLWKRVSDHEMPPKKPLPEAEKAVLKAWIANGAKWGTDPIDPFAVTTSTRAGRDWWSLQPVQKVTVPGPKTANPIDAFIDAQLAAKKWTRAPQADRRTLIRRVYYDLLGLPPSFEEVEKFAADDTSDAYAKLVDRLLASQHYGERWGRYWLDVVRYAETCGYERDQVKPNVWKYRDWVINAYNNDMPFARFVQAQLAGDELPDANANTLIATGFIRLGTWNDEPNDAKEYQYDRLEDMVGATSTAFLALTVKCARCHDHKFDPITQRDYYRMGSVFWSGYVTPGPGQNLGGPDAKALGQDGIFGWTDRGPNALELHLLKKGDPNRPGVPIVPGQLSAIPALEKPFAPPPAGAKTTTRRLQFAKWITDPRNPLAARVWVNRIWQGHFGTGLVRTPDNFGFTGEKPTHPELLDYLATEFLANGGHSKPLHRMILLSQTYQQSSLHSMQEEYSKTDAANHHWWHADRRRLDAEALRDSLLSVGGNLKLDRIGGPSFTPTIPPDALEGLSMKSAAWKPSPQEEQGRRSVYIFAKRGLLPPLLTTFDLPDTTLPNCRRDVTTVPTQALALLNNPFVHEQSAALAKRIDTKLDPQEQAIRAWQLALCRNPRPAELNSARAFLQHQRTLFSARPNPASDALTSLCHVLLNTNEFITID